MKQVLFICRANVGRSQIAEGYYNAFAKKSQGYSAGITDLRKKYNGKPAPAIQTVMQEDGIDITRQRVSLLTEQMMSDADRVIVLCSKREVPDHFLQLSKQITFIEIDDPYNKGIEEVRYIRDEIKELVTQILQEEEGVL